MSNVPTLVHGHGRLCPDCGLLFNSRFAFDRHRVVVARSPQRNVKSQRRCLTPDEMQAQGMTRNKAGFWISESFAAMRLAALRPAAVEGADDA